MLGQLHTYLKVHHNTLSSDLAYNFYLPGSRVCTELENPYTLTCFPTTKGLTKTNFLKSVDTRRSQLGLGASDSRLPDAGVAL